MPRRRQSNPQRRPDAAVDADPTDEPVAQRARRASASRRRAPPRKQKAPTPAGDPLPPFPSEKLTFREAAASTYPHWRGQYSTEYEWVPPWRVSSPFPEDSVLQPRAFVVGNLEDGVDVSFDRVEVSEGEREELSNFDRDHVWVRDCDGLGYVGKSQILAARSFNPAFYYGGWEKWDQSSERLLVRCFKVNSNQVLEASVETRMQGVAVAMSFLVHVGVLQFRFIAATRSVQMLIVERRGAPAEPHEIKGQEKSSVGAAGTRRLPYSATTAARIRVALSAFLRWLVAREQANLVREDCPLDVEWLFKSVGRKPDDHDSDSYAQWLHSVRSATSALKATLAPYQERAVAWMLGRERRSTTANSPGSEAAGPESVLSDTGPGEPWVTWHEDESNSVVMLEGKVPSHSQEVSVVGRLIGNVATGDVWFGDSSPSREEQLQASHSSPGGLLCCEMGLGKTVQSIGLMLANPRRDVSFDDPPVPVEPATGAQISCLECKDNFAFDPCMPRTGERVNVDPYTGEYHSRWIACRECFGFAHTSCAKKGARKLKNYVCQRCCHKSYVSEVDDEDSLIKSRATLVVVPQMLLTQWSQELSRHGPSNLSVVIFDGLAGDSGYVALHRLARADIVLTTYDALRNDTSVVAHMRSSHKFRFEKKYRATPTPLLAIEWWRVCLDEAQMVESRSSRVAQMAKELCARHRWCVTGTPIRSSIAELAPLLSFLRVEAFANPQQWEYAFVDPAIDGIVTDRERLRCALRNFMWRTNKSDVEGSELHLPPQSVQVVRISLGVVEKYFYNSVFNDVQDDIRARLNTPGRRHDFSALNLQELRQACIHPQIGAVGRRLLHVRQNRRGHRLGGDAENSRKRRGGPLAEVQQRLANPLTMDEVLDSLVAKARLECVEAQRAFVCSSHGLAGVLLLQGADGDIIEAIRVYRNVLALEEKNRPLYRMDAIQVLHALHNLNDSLKLLENRSSGLEDSARLETLREVCRRRGAREMNLGTECHNRRKVYVSDARGRLEVAMQAFRDARNAAEERISALWGAAAPTGNSKRRRGPGEAWWSLALGILIETGHSDIFMDRVVHSLLEGMRTFGLSDLSQSLASKLQPFCQVESVIDEGVDSIEDAREAVLNLLETLPGAVEPTLAHIRESGSCPFCREVGIEGGSQCVHCRQEHVLEKYESVLYNCRGKKGRKEKRQAFAVGADELAGGYEGPDEVWEDEVPSAPKKRARSTNHRDVAAVVQSTMRQRKAKPGVLLQHVRGVSEFERLMGMLASVIRAHGDREAQAQAEAWFKVLEAYKKELDACKRAFMAQRELLGELDELEQTLQRLSVVEDDVARSRLSALEQLFVVSKSMLPSLRESFVAEMAAGEAVMASKHSNLIYLSSLSGRAEVNEAEAAGDSRKCPICLMEVKAKVGLYLCGHRFCSECVSLLIRRASATKSAEVLCPSCRQPTRIDDVQFATLLDQQDPRQAAVSKSGPHVAGGLRAAARPARCGASSNPRGELGGSENCDALGVPGAAGPSEKRNRADIFPRIYEGELESTFHDTSQSVSGDKLSSKVSAIVRVLKSISKHDPQAKSLIFSQWSEVLDIVSSALQENGIEHATLASTSTSNRRTSVLSQRRSPLDEFKMSGTVNVMLLTLGKGATGLNVVEATHVLLIEPSLNPAIEAQAISRVHRLSQTKRTYVHRFVVDGSIEELVRKIAVDQGNSVQAGAGEVVNLSDVQDLLQ